MVAGLLFGASLAGCSLYTKGVLFNNANETIHVFGEKLAHGHATTFSFGWTPNSYFPLIMKISGTTTISCNIPFVPQSYHKKGVFIDSVRYQIGPTRILYAVPPTAQFPFTDLSNQPEGFPILLTEGECGEKFDHFFPFSRPLTLPADIFSPTWSPPLSSRSE